MIDAVFAHRIQFAFTVMFHYLFPILTMGLGFFIALLSTLHLATGKEQYAQAARFWAKIFAINFALGVVTGIPLEFEFGTNWSRFSAFGGHYFNGATALERFYTIYA
jgi:cytochrome d ubiquinol oxidase subunit I